MKTYTFTIEGREVTVQAVPVQGKSAVDFTARCDGDSYNSRMSLHPKPSQTREQVEKDLHSEAERLAVKAAGDKQSNSLLDDIFGEQGGAT